MTKEAFVLRLYISGRSPLTALALANLKRLCDETMAHGYQLEVIDVCEDPQRAEDEHVLATPTLIKEIPVPLQRIIGDLSNSEAVILALDLQRIDGARLERV